MRPVDAAKVCSRRLPIRRPATPANGPLITTRSLNTVLLSEASIMCSYVIVSPGNFETPTHVLGGSTLVMVEVVGGPPCTFIVIFAPTTKSPSISAASITPPGHSGGFVQTDQTVDAGAEHVEDPSYDRRRSFMKPMIASSKDHRSRYDRVGCRRESPGE
jgi:hypothetical protein